MPPFCRAAVSEACSAFDELVDVRHAAVEAQLRHVLGDLGERPVRGLAQRQNAASPPPPWLRRRSAISAASRTSRHSFCTKRQEPCTPSSVQITSRSGGESDSMNQRATSAPYSPMMSSGSTVFRFDFDIFSIEPMFTSSPVAIRVARRPLAPVSIFTSAGVTQPPCGLLVGLVHHHALA